MKWELSDSEKGPMEGSRVWPFSSKILGTPIIARCFSFVASVDVLRQIASSSTNGFATSCCAPRRSDDVVSILFRVHLFCLM